MAVGSGHGEEGSSAQPPPVLDSDAANIVKRGSSATTRETPGDPVLRCGLSWVTPKRVPVCGVTHNTHPPEQIPSACTGDTSSQQNTPPQPHYLGPRAPHGAHSPRLWAVASSRSSRSSSGRMVLVPSSECGRRAGAKRLVPPAGPACGLQPPTFLCGRSPAANRSGSFPCRALRYGWVPAGWCAEHCHARGTGGSQSAIPRRGPLGWVNPRPGVPVPWRTKHPALYEPCAPRS